MFPHRTPFREPGFGTPKCAHFEPTGSDTTRLDGLNQPGVAQDLKMLVNRWERYIEGCGQFRNRDRTIGQSLKDNPSGRVAQCAKDVVDLRP